MRLFRLALAMMLLVATTACSDTITSPNGPNDPACPGGAAGSGC